MKNEDDYWKATKYYFDCIIGPFKPFMLKALERVRQLDVSIICTGHGPVLDAGIDKMYNTYEEWCTVVNPNQKKTVVMPYVSAYAIPASWQSRLQRESRTAAISRCAVMIW